MVKCIGPSDRLKEKRAITFIPSLPPAESAVPPPLLLQYDPALSREMIMIHILYALKKGVVRTILASQPIENRIDSKGSVPVMLR